MSKIDVHTVFTSSPLVGPRIMVPVTIEALLVDRLGNAADYADLTPMYDLLEKDMVLGDEILNSYFTTSPELKQGTHLHWALPDALTHGIQDPKSENLNYPCVPNRWFVLRTHTSAGSDSTPLITLKAWLIESDYLTNKQTMYNTNSITVPTLDSSISKFMYMGQKGEYGVDNLPPGLYLDRLTAVGPGDPVFAAYYPNCKSVFGFYDPLDDIPQGTLSYMVAGWYFRSEQDPMHGQTSDQWKACLDELHWSVLDSTKIYPVQTLCHGLIYGIMWEGPDGKYPLGSPSGTIDIAVGNSSIEALSALLASKLPNDKNVERLMEAFQYDLLSKWDSPDGIMQFEEKIHENMFETKDGGILWVIRRSQDTAQDTAANPDQPFPGSIGMDLGSLNNLQLQYDSLTRQLASLQWELYSTWYKYVSAESDPFSTGSTADIEIVINNIINEINGVIKQQISDIGSQIDQLVSDLKNHINSYIPLYVLEQTPAPRFYQPNAPVVLFSGEGIQRSYKHGTDGRFSNDGTLFCRVTGQTISSLTLFAAGKQVRVTGSDILSFCMHIPSGIPIPAEIQDLLVETLFLDPNQAYPIAVAAFSLAGIPSPTQQQLNDLAQTIVKLQNVPLNAAIYPTLDPQALVASAGFEGAFPSKVGLIPWSAPWTPLYIEWLVNLLPAKTIDRPDNSLDSWTLGDIDYSWNKPYPPDKVSHQFKGCVLITPHAPVNLKAALDKYIITHQPEESLYSELQDISNGIGHLNILSQAISGFNDDLLMRKQTLQFPVFDVPKPEGNPDLALRVAQSVENNNTVSPMPEIDYNPIRAGFMKIMDLWIVDSFGSVQKINITPPVLSEAMKTPGNAFNGLITLSPRISQTSRLNFRWVSASDETIETNSDPATNPVCGWIMPNHLDRSLMVYDNGGNMLGSLQTVFRTDGTASVIWLGAPGTDVKSSSSSLDISDPKLNGFVTELLNYGASGVPALAELLVNIDEALQNIEPQGAYHSQNISVLIGRPLALVRASLKLELEGLPAYNQGWNYIGGCESNGFIDVSFTVRLGDMRKIGDGLVGFFIDNGNETYKTFHPTNGASEKESGSPYIDSSDKVKLQFNPDTQPLKLTLLVDPRAKVHATSGILPVKSIELSPDFIFSALSAINVTFLVNPLLNASTPVNLPIPGGIKGDWSWVYHEDTTTWKEDSNLGNAQQNALLPPRPQQIIEGWLKLFTAQAMVPNDTSNNQKREGDIVKNKAGNKKLNLLYGFNPPDKVYLTKDIQNPLINTLVFNIANPSDKDLVTFVNKGKLTSADNIPTMEDTSPSNDLSMFHIHFPYGNDIGDFCTNNEAQNITCSPRKDIDDWYTVQRTSPTGGVYWTLFPKSETVLSANQSVPFILDKISINTNTLAKPAMTYMEILSRGIPGYNDDAAQVIVYKTYPVSILTFDASPASFKPGQEVQLSWTTDAADFCSITPDVGQVPTNGICKVTPDKDTTYILIAFGDNGPAEKSKKVCILPPSILSFSAVPDRFRPHQPVQLSWATDTADFCSITPDVGIVPTSGSAQIYPQKDITYTLTANGQGTRTSLNLEVKQKTTGWYKSVTLGNDICGNDMPAIMELNEKIWMIGGGRVWASDDGTSWSQLTVGAPFGNRSLSAASVFNNELWIMGGTCSSDLVGSNDVWKSLDGTNWTRVTASAAWKPRTSATGVTFQNKLWLIAGSEYNRSKSINNGSNIYYNEVWNSSDGVNWNCATSNPPWTDLNYITAAVLNNRLYILGVNFSTSAFEMFYSDNGSAWVKMPSPPFGLKRSNALLALAGKLWFISCQAYESNASSEMWCAGPGGDWSQCSGCLPWNGIYIASFGVYEGCLWMMGVAWDTERSGHEIWYYLP